MARRPGRKSKEEKLQLLKEQLLKKKEQREKIDEEIKVLESKIAELEQYFLLQETDKLKAILQKKGISLDKLAEAIEQDRIQLD